MDLGTAASAQKALLADDQMENHIGAPSVAPLLRSGDHGDILDMIDTLRSKGISRYVSLPQIIVCGDQSSGKSSVLEAISGVRFPVKGTLCTRFPTELVLRRAGQTSVTVSIRPDDKRSEAEQDKLKQFARTELDMDEFASIVEAAAEAMGLRSDSKAFSNDVLHVEISGPDQPHLTLVDLPGLVHARTTQHSEEDVALIRSMVRRYMESSRSIILAVISASTDLALQVVTELTRKVDRKGLRTLGVITKPDRIDGDPENAAAYVRLARNEEIVFRLGWHVLRNRDYESRSSSGAERDRQEQEFFSAGVWATLPAHMLGIDTLRRRLTMVLKDHIVSELPGFIADMEEGVRQCRKTLERLGVARTTAREQESYLIQISERFCSLVQSAVDGSYNDGFFGEAMSDEGFSKRLRAVVQDLLMTFQSEMKRKGHSQQIIGDGETAKKKAFPAQIRRADFVEEVLELVRRTRGCELPGTFNPRVIGDLFLQQSKPWKALVERYAARIIEAVRNFLELALVHTADESTGAGLLRAIIEPAMERYTASLAERVEEIMWPHLSCHPITYNHYFIETTQRARSEHFRKRHEESLGAFFGTGYAKGWVSKGFDAKALLDSLGEWTKTDMDRFACSEATECMQAYYKVAMKTVIDSFASLAVERCVISTVAKTLTPATVRGLDADLVRRIATESEASAAERERASEKLDTLEKGLRKFHEYDRDKLAGERVHAAFDISDSAPSESADDVGGEADDTDEDSEVDVQEIVELAQRLRRQE